MVGGDTLWLDRTNLSSRAWRGLARGQNHIRQWGTADRHRGFRSARLPGVRARRRGRSAVGHRHGRLAPSEGGDGSIRFAVATIAVDHLDSSDDSLAWHW